jgi:hypothetical protein
MCGLPGGARSKREGCVVRELKDEQLDQVVGGARVFDVSSLVNAAGSVFGWTPNQKAQLTAQLNADQQSGKYGKAIADYVNAVSGSMPSRGL